MINNYKIKLYRILLVPVLFVCVVLTSCQETTTKTKKKANNVVDKTNHDTIKDSVLFSKTLTLQSINYNIKAFKNNVVITPNGYLVDNNPVHKQIDGTVTNAEIEDLNYDGYPEIMIFINSSGSGSYGTLIGFSSNSNKSMSEIAFPSLIDNPKINKGYMGHDEFTIIETKVVQRFPIYNVRDTNSNPTGKTRQIQYKLIEGEASRKLVVDKIIEF